MSEKNFLEFLDTETRISSFRISMPSEKMRPVIKDNIKKNYSENPLVRELWEKFSYDSSPMNRIEICANIQFLDERNLQSYYHMIAAYSELKQISEIENKLKILENIAPNSSEFYLSSAVLNIELKKHEEAIIQYDKALEIDQIGRAHV